MFSLTRMLSTIPAASALSLFYNRNATTPNYENVTTPNYENATTPNYENVTTLSSYEHHPTSMLGLMFKHYSETGNNSTHHLDSHSELFAFQIGNVNEYLKSADSPLSNDFSALMGNFSEYLTDLFSIQEELLKFLSGETENTSTEMKTNPISSFILKNRRYPLDEFRAKYFEFVMKHLVEKYDEEFKVHDDVPSVIENHISIGNQKAEHHVKEGTFESLVDFLKFANKWILAMKCPVETEDLHSKN